MRKTISKKSPTKQKSKTEPKTNPPSSVERCIPKLNIFRAGVPFYQWNYPYPYPEASTYVPVEMLAVFPLSLNVTSDMGIFDIHFAMSMYDITYALHNYDKKYSSFEFGVVKYETLLYIFAKYNNGRLHMHRSNIILNEETTKEFMSELRKLQPAFRAEADQLIQRHYVYYSDEDSEEE